MKTQVIRDGEKIVVKFGQSEPSKKTILKWERELGCKLSYCAYRNDCLILWNGPSNVRVAGWAKPAKRLRSTFTYASAVDCLHGRTPQIVKTIQSRYSKMRYVRKFSQRIYEGLVRPKANGMNIVGAFTAPVLP